MPRERERIYAASYDTRMCARSKHRMLSLSSLVLVLSPSILSLSPHPDIIILIVSIALSAYKTPPLRIMH